MNTAVSNEILVSGLILFLDASEFLTTKELGLSRSIAFCYSNKRTLAALYVIWSWIVEGWFALDLYLLWAWTCPPGF